MMTYPDTSTAMSNAVAAYSGAVKILKRGIDFGRTREIEAGCSGYSTTSNWPSARSASRKAGDRW
jgi:hypothetical protein